MAKQYWLVKQEPESYSWDDFVNEGGTEWTGIRNYQARLNLRAMKKGDVVFFYHSVSEKRVVGLAKVSREQFPDPTASEGEWVAVGLKPVKAMKTPVTLEQIKKDDELSGMLLVRHTRLSTMPVTATQAKRLLELGRTRS
jgi:predicted RNA-binding protein with PUA-like domain